MFKVNLSCVADDSFYGRNFEYAHAQEGRKKLPSRVPLARSIKLSGACHAG